MEKIRWGIIGAGGIADLRTIPGLLQCGNAQLQAVMRTDLQRARETQAKWNCPAAYDSVEALLADPNALPGDVGTLEKVMDRAVQKTLKRKANKNVILGLSSILVWFVAMVAFVVLNALDIPEAWMAFVYALPADAIVMLSLRSAWRDFRWNQTLVSVIMWGGILGLFMSLLMFADRNIWTLFLLGIPGQAAILLWFRMYRKPHKEDSHG